MYGSYAHADDCEDESVSGSFNIASLVDSNKKYKRRMGQSDRGGATSFKPVRIGQSVTKSMGPARRFLAPAKGVGSSDFQRKMSDVIEESDDKNIKVKKEADLSLSEAFLDSLRLDTPAGKGRSRVDITEGRGVDVPGPPGKVSPDSGSFTMTQPVTGTVKEEMETETGVDFTDTLLDRDRDRPVRMGRAGAPVRMNFTGPARLPQNKPFAREDNHEVEAENKYKHNMVEREQDKENLPHQHAEQGGARPKQFSAYQPTNSTSRIRERLQSLSGSNTNTAPIQPFSTPTMPPHKEVTLIKATTLPPQHIHTPLPSANPTPIQRPEPTMPPPSMAMSTHQSREQVIVVKNKRYRVMKLLGKGGSSRVYEAFDEEKNVVVAIKRVDLSDADEAQTAGYVNEINMLSKLQGEDRIVRLHDHEKVDSEDILYVILEKGDTDLASLLKKYSNNREITPAMIKHYWTEMLHAVAIIHKRGIIHKDIKPANFLLVAGRLKLIDFGIASSVQSDKTSVYIDNQMGTFNFMSPESIQDLNGPQFDNMGNRKPCIKISFKSDVWSLGCILYQLTYGKMPFGDIKHPLMKLQAITNVNHPIQFPILPDGDLVLISVIKECLVRDPRARPSIADLLNHGYVTGLEVVKEEEKKLDPVSAVKMLAALEGVLSPTTFKKTSEAYRSIAENNGRKPH